MISPGAALKTCSEEMPQGSARRYGTDGELEPASQSSGIAWTLQAFSQDAPAETPVLASGAGEAADDASARGSCRIFEGGAGSGRHVSEALSQHRQDGLDDFSDDGGDWQWAQDLMEETDVDELAVIVPKGAKESLSKVMTSRSDRLPLVTAAWGTGTATETTFRSGGPTTFRSGPPFFSTEASTAASPRRHPNEAPVIPRGLLQQASRIMDVEVTPKPLPPVTGIKRVPVMSLTDCTVHLFTSVVGLQPCVSTALSLARERISSQGPDRYGLTEDMTACIHLFTSPVAHAAINSVLRSENREAVKRFLPVLRLLLDALERLPTYTGTVYRGTRQDLSQSYVVGQDIPLWSFQSATTRADVLRNDAFLGSTGTRSLLRLHITGGKDISMYSASTEEQEIVIPAGCTFTVEDVGDGVREGERMFSMRQISASELMPSVNRNMEGSMKCCSVQ